MNKNKVFFLLFSILIGHYINTLVLYLPFDAKNRRILKKEYITPAGEFGIWRKAYKNVPPHYHAGIDFINPGNKGSLQPIYSCAKGKVLFINNNGSSSYIIIKHKLSKNKYIYSTYTHIRDITVSIGDSVNEYSVIGRFMSRHELNKWGEYLNHLHFEILKVPPKCFYIGIKNTPFYISYTIDCKTSKELFKCFYNPLLFFIKE